MLALLQTLQRVQLVPLALTVGLASATASAETWTVGEDALTSDFTSIQDAVNAAAAGDTILVAPGDYVGFRVALKPLTILGAGSQQTRINAVAGSFFTTESAIGVEFVNEGSVRIGGFSVELPEPDFFPGIVPRYVALRDCDASLELFDVEVLNPCPDYWDLFNLGPNSPQNSGYFNVADCRQVMLSDVRVAGAAQQVFPDLDTAGSAFGLPEGYAGLMLHDSLAWVSNSHFEGSNIVHCYAEGEALKPMRSGSGARLWNSRLVASNTSFQGGQGQSDFGPTCVNLEAGAGIVLQYGSQAELLGGPLAEVQGGSSFGSAQGGSGATLYGPSSLLYATDTTPAGGFSGSGLIMPSIAELNPDLVQVIELDSQRPVMTSSASFAQQGESFQLDLLGNPNGVQVVLWETEIGGQLPSPLIIGDLFLDPASAQMLGVFTLDGAGAATTTLQVPVGPEFAGVSIAMQTTELVHPQFLSAPPLFVATSL